MKTPMLQGRMKNSLLLLKNKISVMQSTKRVIKKKKEKKTLLESNKFK